MSSVNKSRNLLTSDDTELKGKRDMALSLLKRGADRNKIIQATGFTSDELFVIEQSYYDSRQELSPRNMRIKQLDRLDALVDMAYSQIEMFGLADEKGNWGQNLQAVLAVLREISEVANLKRQTVTHEIRVIEEKQVNIMLSFTNQVLEEYTAIMYPHLSAGAKKALEVNKADWFAQAVNKPAALLEATVEVEGE
jgi:hypothetical protein|nr:MAG TPA: hypothetical protein [Caudoviricetes sp.]